ncbi:MAG: ribosomal protection-like ABC-F family protein [Spirochaetota bacterium]
MRIQINNLSHDFAGTVVLASINASIATGDHIGIVGANGCGKTTFVRILCGELEPVSGSVTKEPGTRIGYVPQAMEPGGASTIAEYLLADIYAMRRELEALEHRMGEAGDELDRVLERYATERERYEAAHGDTAEERAERLLGELGLAAGLDQELATLSGGEQNVLALGRAVISQPDLLVLDEPGNHLDFAGLAWLEEYLRRYPGAVLVVSHNRYLLDRVAETIWEIDRGRLSSYTGNYSDYRFSRLSQALSDQATYAVQQLKLARLEELVRTFEERARVTGDPKWGKRLRARRTQLAKARDAAMEAPSLEDDPIEIAFRRTNVKSDIAVEIKGYRKGFGERVLFDDARLTVHVGDRVGIVGPNGSGKTTLLEERVRTGDWDNAVLRVGPSMRVGYCAQKRGRFPETMSLLDAMLTTGSYSRREVFGVLSRLRFEWDDLDRPVGSLSGGEWNRLQLALAIISHANLLILDEPTNHLDIPSREAVEEALTEFDGTIITVSHDR